MRDLFMFAIVLGGLPFIVRRPWIGVMYWVWLSVMNPHRLSWGMAYSFPFAQLVALATLMGLFFTKDPRQFKGGTMAVVLLLFILHTALTTFTALVPEEAQVMLVRVLKIQMLTFIALIVLHKREHLVWMVWMIVISIGYYAIKGGIFTLATGGAFRVWGPAESFIADNNALALATVMTIPLWSYLYIYYRGRRWRWLFLLAIGLSAISALGSQSRGALLAIGGMAIFLWLKGKRKLLVGTALVVMAFSLVNFMPQSWKDRMDTIGTYKSDESAMGRIETWGMLFDIAADRPLVGGGFEPYSRKVLEHYRPGYDTVRAAHSIYFQVLGEHGFLGFGLLALFWTLTLLTAYRIVRDTQNKPEFEWAFWLARMIQVSFLAYFIGGSFLNLAYWDVPYYLMVMLAVTAYIVRNTPTANTPPAHPAPAALPAQPPFPPAVH